ncbi:MAG: amidohydrolase [Chloroflexi bacterium]|nr:amidohydrolase [Chloroflexota bacterium]
MSVRPPVLDADGHVFERDEVLYQYLDSPFAGCVDMLYESFFPTNDGWHRTAHALALAQKRRGETYRHEGQQAPDRPEITAQEWLKALDLTGIEATVLYPTRGLGFGRVRDPDWAVGLARAYNNWLYDQFTKQSSRLLGVALVPVQNPECAVVELRRAVDELGMVGGLLPGAGLKRAFGDEMYFPIYAAAQDMGVPLIVHGGSAEGMGLDIFEHALEARALAHQSGQVIQLTSMIFGGVFDRFPKLRVGYAEASVCWLPYVYDRLQRAYRNWFIEVPAVKTDPREVLRSGRLFFHTELDDAALGAVVGMLGDEMMFYASDFPHEPVQEVEETLDTFLAREDLATVTKQRILNDNARRLYSL